MSLYVEKYLFLQSFRLTCLKLLFFIFSDIIYKKDRMNFMTKLINRPEYLNQLISNKDIHLVKIVTGICRCGNNVKFYIIVKIILSMDRSYIKSYEGIKSLYLIDWLLS